MVVAADMLVAQLVRYGYRARLDGGTIYVGRAAVTNAEAVALLDDWSPKWREDIGAFPE